MCSVILKARLDLLPSSPGVYLMKDKSGRIIYIGKAANLKNRVRSYFNHSSSAGHLAASLLKKKACNIDWIITANEVEALILEANLVKKHAPRYNIMLKDDKHFPYLKLTLSEPFPHLAVTRNTSSKADMYFGPYTDSRAMHQTMRTIHKVFRIRDCKLKLPLAKPIKPCLTYHIGRCDAPCSFLYDEASYGILVKQVILLLRGKSRELTDILTKEMKKLSSLCDFEQAAKVRDQINAVESILRKQRMDLGGVSSSLDIIAVARIGKIGSGVIIQVREGIVIDRKCFELSCFLDQSESEIITNFVKTQYQEGGSIPGTVILSHNLLKEENLPEVFRQLRQGPLNIEVPQKGKKKYQVDLALANAKMAVVEFVAKNEKRDRIDYSVKALQEDLGLPCLPRHIEAFDISHLGGTDTVASNVVFVDGQPKKNLSRKYIIKTVEGVDDFSSIREVVGRRLRRLLEEQKPLPDLILIDGGKGQLSSALKIYSELGLKTDNILGLAKRLEEIYVPGSSRAIYLPPASHSLKLLQALRDESHRFAITFQRSRRKKYLQKTWLDEIPGVGAVTRKKLLNAFKTPAAVKAQTLETLQDVAGRVLAGRIHAYRPGS